MKGFLHRFLAIAAKGSGLMIDNANVVKVDIAASNGVIHVNEGVILPR